MAFDFIIIGSGLAGLTSALIMSAWGKVLIVTKGKLSQTATSWAQGGIACVVKDKDSLSWHAKDTLVAGAFHNNKKAVEFLVKNASQAVNWLEKQGVVFDKKSTGAYEPGLEGGHSYARILHATDFTGKIVESALIERVRATKNITIWKNTFAVDLLVRHGICYGVVIIREALKTDIYSRVVVLATGGLGTLYQWTTNPTVATGDGIAMAARAGAEISDLEFIQFHPTALKHGNSPLFLLSEAIRGEGARLIRIKNSELRIQNRQAERFMHMLHHQAELAPRDIVTRAIVSEQKKGSDIYLDIRHRGKLFLKKRFPNISRELSLRGLDLSSDLIPVTPAAHYSCGGVKVDLYGRTSIKNLFAFGEVAATGVHGANRLASNSLLEAVVFPLQLPLIRSEFPKIVAMRADPLKHIKAPVEKEVIEVLEMKRELQNLMWEKVGVVRTRQGLAQAYEQIGKWNKEASRIKKTTVAIYELQNMLLTSQLIVEAALKRKKSLGAHYRQRN